MNADGFADYSILRNN